MFSWFKTKNFTTQTKVGLSTFVPKTFSGGFETTATENLAIAAGEHSEKFIPKT